jgi:hypothetical protein
MSKQQILELIEALPDNVNLDAFIEKLYPLRRLELAEEEIAAGKLIDHEMI